VLTVSEIYLSVQGESTHAGRPCVFVRLTGCDLRCAWCDTAHAFSGGRKMAVGDVISEVARLRCPLVEVTGGEPLLQRDAYPLMKTLVGRGLTVLLETGGHVPIDEVPDGVVKIVDVKCPASGEADKMHWPNLARLTPLDEVKFVIQDRADFEYARTIVARHALGNRAGAVLFSPVHGLLPPAELARWMLDDIPARLQIQAHKYVWGADTRGV